MTIHDQDTDPSTPESRREPPRRAQEQTDPGVGPPSSGVPALGKPMGIVVPAPTPPAPEVAVRIFNSAPRTKDSVELLLEGMTGPRPDRTKIVAQSAGQASASYHAEHAVQAARTSPDAEPAVLVETGRAMQLEQTDPPSRLLVQDAPEAELPEGWNPAVRKLHVLSRNLVAQVGVALALALVVVWCVHRVFDRSPKGHDGAVQASAPAPAQAETTAGPAVAAPTPAVAEGHDIAEAPEAAEVPVEERAASLPTPPPQQVQARPLRAKPDVEHVVRARAARAPVHGSDLGEFKSAF